MKRRGQLQAVEEPGEPNAETLVEHLGDGLYRLTPRTGRTHQLRVHMASLGLPIVGDPLYPEVIDVAPDDFSRPLQLLAHSLEIRRSGQRASAASSSADAHWPVHSERHRRMSGGSAANAPAAITARFRSATVLSTTLTSHRS